MVGADIGGRNLRMAAADLVGEPIFDLTRPTSHDGELAVGTQLLEMLGEVVARVRASHGQPLVLAISTPGIVDEASGIVTSLAYNVSPTGGFDPLEGIRDRLEMPVLVENNVNVAAVGERWFGLARDVPTMVFVSLGAGIGMGIVVNDELVHGAHGAAGEIAYLPVAGGSSDPRHRRSGVLEDEVGADAIVASFNAARGAEDPVLTSAGAVFDMAAAGNPTARGIVDHVTSRIATTIASVCAILDPELVVLGGGIGSSPQLLVPVREAVAALLPFARRVETSLLGDRAEVQGAVALALRSARASLLSGGSVTGVRFAPSPAASPVDDSAGGPAAGPVDGPAGGPAAGPADGSAGSSAGSQAG